METNGRLNFGPTPADYKNKALALLTKCKERDAMENLVTVRIDKNTVKLMPREKAEKYLKSKQL